MALPIAPLSARVRKEPQGLILSPLKLLSNTDPSPVKSSLPNLLRNPFNQPVKRKLNLGSPAKDASTITNSARKKHRMLELDEDANLEPPKMKRTINLCYKNDWTLRTKLRVNFNGQCKNWNGAMLSTHRRLGLLTMGESPSKPNDNTISLEAIKNIATVYQHPYLSWMALYPRLTPESNGVAKSDLQFNMFRHSEASEMMLKDWCESFTDLVTLLISGKCPYFYLCSDYLNILFTGGQNQELSAYVTPFPYKLKCQLDKLGITCEYALQNSSMDDSNTSKSQSADSQDSIDQIKVSKDENDGETSDFLTDIWGVSRQELSTQYRDRFARKAAFMESDSSTQSRTTTKLPLAIIRGTSNIRKLVRFLQTNRTYTISATGRFACIPPTLLSPCEFRLCTPQYPVVAMSQNSTQTEPYSGSRSILMTPQKSSGAADDDTPVGPTFIELKGTILPNFYNKLHRLLALSDNGGHSCSSHILETSRPFCDVEFH